ncbi:MAG TPA: NUDIX domain-containing protein [Mycobacteriales bacterium]|nr:NUDIX domain-containing protein [Mycobacteriales bacterium]
MRTERRAVKLLIFDPEDRLLLLRAADPASERWGWYPVGGGIEPGEDVQQAARREAAEETGLGSLHFGPEVWRRRHVYRWLGTSRQVYERWFVVRAAHFIPDFGGLSPGERRSVTGSRWWTAAELAQSEEPFAPPDLPGRVRDLLAHGPPAAPIELSPVSENEAS